MKSKFSEYYRLSDEHIKAIWEHGTIVLDTNVLLNLYRYTPSTQQDLLKLLDKCQQRLWMPYQVGLEFHRNRESVLIEKENEFDQMISSLQDAKAAFIEKLQLSKHQRHPYFRGDSLTKGVDDLVSQLDGQVKKWKETYSDIRKNDTVLSQLNDFYNGKAGDDYPEAKLEEIYKEGKSRYENLIPPGFGDLKEKEKKGSRHLYGDLIIWHEVMDFVNSQDPKTDVIYVTDDSTKEDWFSRPHGKTTGPLPALLMEFKKETSQNILILTADSFIQQAKTYLLQDMKTDTIQEVETLSQEQLEERKRISAEIIKEAQEDLLKKHTFPIPHTYSGYMAKPQTAYFPYAGTYLRDIISSEREAPVISRETDAMLRSFGIEPGSVLYQDMERVIKKANEGNNEE